MEAAAERGLKKLLLATFDDSFTKKPKHPIMLHANITYFKLIQRTRKNYRKLHQLKMPELLQNIASYFKTNAGFTTYIDRMKEAQKTVATIDLNLINDTTLLRIGM